MDNGNATDPDATSRRRSGRVVRAPDKFSPDIATQPSQAKRKRQGGDDGDEDDDNENDDDDDSELSDEESDDDVEDDVSDDEATSRRAQSKRAKKHRSKKPKTNGSRPAAPSRTKDLSRMFRKSIRLDTGGKGNGLYSE